MPFSASRRTGSGDVSLLVFGKQRDLFDLHDVRLSMTRLALPSLRSMECASTSVTPDADAEHAVERALQALIQLLQGSDLVFEHLRRDFDLALPSGRGRARA